MKQSKKQAKPLSGGTPGKGTALQRTPPKPKPVRGIYEDTQIIPEAAGEGVAEYMNVLAGRPLTREEVRAYGDRLALDAETVYKGKNNARFRQRVRSTRDRGNAGRDYLGTFMEHWLASYLKNERPGVFRTLRERAKGYGSLEVAYWANRDLTKSRHE